jgi:peptidoglycan/xylan/chitin deacetylase (PgdA/CDA1 family)
VNQGAPAEWQFERNGFELNWRSSEELQSRAYPRALEDLRALPSHDRDAVLSELRVVLKSEAPRSTHLPMTREELRAFAGSSSVVIGAHTLGHPSLARLHAEEQRQEIEGSKRDLQDMLGIEIPYFSYPFGTGADFDDTTIALAEAAGFTHVAANYPGFVHARSPQFKFPRFLVRNWDGPTFAGQLKGFFNG